MAWSQRSPFLYVNDQAPIGLQYNQTTLVWETIFLDENQNKFVPLSDLFSNPVAPLPIPTNGTDLTLTGFLSAGTSVSSGTLISAGTHFRAPNNTNPATPVYSITGATDKGIYPTTNGIGFAVGGSRVGEFQSWGGGFLNNICNFVNVIGTTDYSGISGTISDLTTTYTPKFSNSLLLIQSEVSWNSTASATIPGLGISTYINGVLQRWYYYYTDRGGTIVNNSIQTLPLTLSSASAITIRTDWTGASGTPTITIYGATSNYNHYLRIWEIMK